MIATKMKTQLTVAALALALLGGSVSAQQTTTTTPGGTTTTGTTIRTDDRRDFDWGWLGLLGLVGLAGLRRREHHDTSTPRTMPR